MVHVNNTHLHEQKKTKNPLYTDDNDDNEEAFHRRTSRSISSHNSQTPLHSCLNSQELRVLDLHQRYEKYKRVKIQAR